MMAEYPRMYRIRQRFDDTALADVPRAVREGLAGARLSARISPGGSAAVTVGSRGIDNLRAIVAAVVEWLKGAGLRPFIVPAMGSHGGATAEGQRGILEQFGVTEASIGAPVVSGMDVISLGRLDNGAEVVVSKDVAEAGHVVVIGRVKPHTAFRSDVESGLCKMLAVGCGKHRGAVNMHKFGLGESIKPAAGMILDRVPVLCGLAILENSLDRTQAIEVAAPEDFIDVDRRLLERSKRLLPRIPVEDLDILIVDEMGKNISGTGIDSNIVGFWRRAGGPRIPDFRTVVLLDITEQSRGNAVGIGMVDLTSKRVIEKIDLEATYANAVSTGIWASARLPIALKDDRAALETALRHVKDLSRVRMARIRNSLHLEYLWVSRAVLDELRGREEIEADETPIEFAFDGDGRLMLFDLPGHGK